MTESVLSFFHTGDWHLDPRYARFPETARNRLLRSRWEAVEALFATAEKEGVPLLLCSGDQFDDGFSASTEALGKLLDIIAGFPGVTCVMITGNHDPLLPGNVYDRYTGRFPANLILVREERIIDIPDLHARIAAAPCRGKHGRENPLRFVSGRPEGSGSFIGLAHGSAEFPGKYSPDDFPIPLSPYTDSLFDYCALGHWHSRTMVSPRCWYPGTILPLGFDDVCGYLRVSLGDGRSGDRGEPAVEPRPVESVISWVSERHDCSDNTIPVILDDIDRRVSPDTLLSLSLTGYAGVERSLELENRLRSLSDRVLDLQLDNKVRIAPSREELARCATDDTLKRIFETLLSIRDGETGILPSLPPESASASLPEGSEPNLVDTADEALLLFHDFLKE